MIWYKATQGIMHSTRGSCRQQGQIEDRVYTGHPPLLTLPNSWQDLSSQNLAFIAHTDTHAHTHTHRQTDNTERERDQMKEPTHGETGPNGTVHILSKIYYAAHGSMHSRNIQQRELQTADSILISKCRVMPAVSGYLAFISATYPSRKLWFITASPMQHTRTHLHTRASIFGRHIKSESRPQP